MTNDEHAQAERGRSASRLRVFDIRRSTFVLATALLAFLPTYAIAAADLSSPDASIEAGREALGDMWGLNWYDSEKDDFRSVEQKPPKDYDWSWLEWITDLFTGWSFDFAGLLKLLLWIVVIALVVWLVWALVKAVQQAELKNTQQQAEEEEARSHVERVEALPVAVERRVDDLLAEARRLLASGDATLAIVYLFSHYLVELDKAHLLRLVKGKTNRQYLRELRRNAPERPRLVSILDETTVVFERAFFGAHPPTREKLEACFARVEEFETLTQIEAD